MVTRQEEQLDPEYEADFDREFAKMMADSLDSRKLDRKQMFDVPLPMRRHQRDAAPTQPDDGTGPEASLPPAAGLESGAAPSMNTMAFSLLTKKGNRQQVRESYSLHPSCLVDMIARHARSSSPRIPTLPSP